ncbi:hypothetical protein NP493_550g05044 [Ridgeia piscesae]|uniref:Uncharacterized protein n=1 Tax=Ridgeia piscesae TaxID=27915 RepID=A0AAD9NPS9_RIDPI|nr:hypothetical protein NP493_550g05044 [Ridgeia piscesae]
MAPGKRQVKARRHLVCNHPQLGGFCRIGVPEKLGQNNGGKGFYVPIFKGCWKVDCLPEIPWAQTDFGGKGEGIGGGGGLQGQQMEKGTTGKQGMREGDGEKVTVEEGGTRGREMRKGGKCDRGKGK